MFPATPARLLCAVCRSRLWQPALLTRTGPLRCLATSVDDEAKSSPQQQLPDQQQQQQPAKPQPFNYEPHVQFVYRGPEGVDPASTSYILFPGQASQFVGMGSKLLEFPRTREIYEHASELLKYDLLKLCLNGPERKLALTQYSQPAIFVTSMAALLALEAKCPEAVSGCIGAAGYSVGEFAAFTFAGTLSFEEGLRLVQIRAQAMQSACDQVPGGMATCMLSAGSNVGKAMQAARDHCRDKLGMERPVCSVASHLYAKCVVLAGHKEAMHHVNEHHSEYGILSCKMLPVSGAFHTDLMYPAGKTLLRALNRCTLRVPRIPVYCNVSVKPPKTVNGIVKLLTKQLHSPVKWHQIVMSLTRRAPDVAHPKIYEVGPGQQLGYVLQKINNKAYANYTSVPV